MSGYSGTYYESAVVERVGLGPDADASVDQNVGSTGRYVHGLVREHLAPFCDRDRDYSRLV